MNRVGGKTATVATTIEIMKNLCGDWNTAKGMSISNKRLTIRVYLGHMVPLGRVSSRLTTDNVPYILCIRSYVDILGLFTGHRWTNRSTYCRQWLVALLLIPIGMFIHKLLDVIKWKHFPRYWPFEKGIQRSPVDSPHKGHWRRALVFSLIYAWTVE